LLLQGYNLKHIVTYSQLQILYPEDFLTKGVLSYNGGNWQCVYPFLENSEAGDPPTLDLDIPFSVDDKEEKENNYSIALAP